MNRNLKEYAFAASLGAVIYGLLEIAVRGKTHWTMPLAGGVTFLLLYIMNTRCVPQSVAARCVLSCVVMTAMEFTVGCIVNRLLGMNVWDYSGRRWNLMGQICPDFCFGWLMLSYPVYRLCFIIREPFKIKGK